MKKLSVRFLVAMMILLMWSGLAAAMESTPKNVPASQASARKELKRLGIPMNEQALEALVRKGDTRAVTLLLDAGMSPNSKCYTDGFPILSFAANVNKPEIVELLLARGADVNQAGPHILTGKVAGKPGTGAPPLFFAAVNGNTEILNLMLSKGAKVNAADRGGMTPLIVAVIYGHANAVKILIGAGADVNARLINGRSALAIAERK